MLISLGYTSFIGFIGKPNFVKTNSYFYFIIPELVFKVIGLLPFFIITSLYYFFQVFYSFHDKVYELSHILNVYLISSLLNSA